MNKKLKCPFCGDLRNHEEYETRQDLEVHTLVEHGLKLPTTEEFDS